MTATSAAISGLASANCRKTFLPQKTMSAWSFQCLGVPPAAGENSGGLDRPLVRPRVRVEVEQGHCDIASTSASAWMCSSSVRVGSEAPARTLAFPGFLLPLDVMATLAESASVGAADLRAFFCPLPPMASGRAA